MAREVGKIIDRERPDLVHTQHLQGFSVATWKAVKKRGLPLVQTLHDYYLLCPKITMYHRDMNCTKLCRSCSLFSRPKQRLSTLVDHVVSVSKFVLDRHLKEHYFTRAKCSVINNYAPDRQEPEGSISCGTVKFGFLGQLTPHKGIEFCLKAYSGIRPGAATLKVAGAGKGDYVNFLRQKYEGPNVHFLGFVSPRELFDQINVLIVPSPWQEALGLVILEAYSFGIPVIAARRGGIPEVVEEGKTGFLLTRPDRGNWSDKSPDFFAAQNWPPTWQTIVGLRPRVFPVPLFAATPGNISRSPGMQNSQNYRLKTPSRDAAAAGKPGLPRCLHECRLILNWTAVMAYQLRGGGKFIVETGPGCPQLTRLARTILLEAWVERAMHGLPTTK